MNKKDKSKRRTGNCKRRRNSMCALACVCVPQFLDTCGQGVGGFLVVVGVSEQWQWGPGHWDLCSCWGDHTTPGYDHDCDHDYDRAGGAVGCVCVSLCVRQRQKQRQEQRQRNKAEEEEQVGGCECVGVLGVCVDESISFIKQTIYVNQQMRKSNRIKATRSNTTQGMEGHGKAQKRRRSSGCGPTGQ